MIEADHYGPVRHSTCLKYILICLVYISFSHLLGSAWDLFDFIPLVDFSLLGGSGSLMVGCSNILNSDCSSVISLGYFSLAYCSKACNISFNCLFSPPLWTLQMHFHASRGFPLWKHYLTLFPCYSIFGISFQFISVPFFPYLLHWYCSMVLLCHHE